MKHNVYLLHLKSTGTVTAAAVVLMAAPSAVLAANVSRRAAS